VDGDPDQGVYSGLVDREGRFSIAGVQAGAYVVRTTFREIVERASCCGGQDITVGPVTVGRNNIDDVVVRLTNLTGSVAGRISVDPVAAPCVVVLIAMNRQSWLAAGISSPVAWATPAETGGTYSFGGLRPGSYRLLAVEKLAAGWRELSALDRLAGLGHEVSVSARELRHDINKVNK
jgi:hypothetical protein